MSTQLYKKCSYLGCSSHQNRNFEITFFQFPKNKDKLKMWIENSQIENSEPVKNKYLCELHFSSIYINKCFKRKMLLNTAIPFAIGETDETFKAPVLNLSRERKNYTITDEAVSGGSINIKNEGPLPPSIPIDYVPIELEEQEEAEFLDNPEISAERDKETNEYYDVVVEKSDQEFLNENSDEDDQFQQVQAPIQQVPVKKRKLEVPDTNKDVVSSSSPTQKTIAPAELKQKVRHTIVVKKHKFDANSSPKVVKEVDQEQSTSHQAQEDTETPTPEEPIAENFYEFIFKGEEYIQIPKKLFLDERAKMRQVQQDIERVRAEERGKVQQLRRDLARYQTLIESVKDQFSNF